MLLKVSPNSKFCTHVLFISLHNNFYNSTIKLISKVKNYERKQDKNCIYNYPKHVKQRLGRDSICIWDITSAQYMFIKDCKEIHKNILVPRWAG